MRMASSKSFEPAEMHDIKVAAQYVETANDDSQRPHHKLDPSLKPHGDRALALLGDERVDLTEEDVSPGPCHPG